MRPFAHAQSLILPLALTVLSTFLAVGCGKKEETHESQTEFRYRFSLNGCDTEEHRFDSKDAMCAALRDSSPGGVNHGCATSMRQDHFVAQGCAGSF